MAEQEDPLLIDQIAKEAERLWKARGGEISWNDPEPPESVLSEAKRLVEGGERNLAYGPPEMDFKRIAGMWTALFEAKLKEGVVFDPADVARAQICLKLSRSTWQKKRDNWTDQAGYAACGHRCETGEW